MSDKQHLNLTYTHKRILDMIIHGFDRKKIAKSLNIGSNTLNSYIRDMNRNNDCNIYQLIYKYAQTKDHVDTNNN